MSANDTGNPSPADPDAGATSRAEALAAVVETMRRVRERCVWTQRITHRDLVPYLVEESAELIDAVEGGTREDLREELGDVLWQVLFHAEIASRAESDPFDIADIAADLNAKMVRRHPHVFGGDVAETPDEVLVLWNAAKAAEKRQRRSVLDGVARGMPALALAQKLIAKAAAVGEEIAPPDGGFAALKSEAALGDALLALVSLACEQGWDAERALRERLRSLESDIRSTEGV